MDVAKNHWSRRLNGSMKITRIPRSSWSGTKADHLLKSKCVCSWQPPYQIACQLPDSFSWTLHCMIDKGGFRRFYPAKPCKVFVFEASLVGHAILADRGKVAQDSNFSLHEARLFNQFSRCTREYLGETIKLGRLLNISPAGRPDAGTKDILPNDLELGATGSGQQRQVLLFKERGIEEAQSAGIAHPTPDQIAWYGLYDAALKAPLPATQAETEDLLKLAFYTLGPDAAKVVPAAVDYVTKHVRASLKDHIDDSTEGFDRWIEDPKANLLSRLAKRKDCRWSREELRRAMLELGWRSFRMLAQCTDACMKAFVASLPQPLTTEEKKLFARTYLAHRDFGGIPLVLLHDRFEVIKPAVLGIWNKPGSRKAVGVLRRLVWYYAEIVANRRAGDRQYKRRSSQKNEDDRPAVDLPLFEEAQATPHEADSEFKQIALRIARDNGHSCNFEGIPWDARLVDEGPRGVIIDITCPVRGFGETLSVSKETFAAIARKVRACATEAE